MFKFVGTLARIVFGLVLASLAAGLVTVLFVDIDVLSGRFDRVPNSLAETIDLALLAATHIGIFSAVFVVITAAIGEFFSIRALTFYILVGVALALLGFSVQYASEVAGQATILNNYALKAFLTVGFVGGFVYWLAAGQFAGRKPVALPAETESPAEATVATERTAPDTDASVVITHPPTTEGRRSVWRKPELEHLRFSKRDRNVDPDVVPDTHTGTEASPAARDPARRDD